MSHDILKGMYLRYFYWQYIVAPAWLLRFFWTLQQMLLQMFSVRLMLRTLVAHWRRDKVSWRQGTLTGLVQAAALNAISRAVGFVVRSFVLVLWAACEVVFLFLAISMWLAFLLAPFVAAASIAYGIFLLLA